MHTSSPLSRARRRPGAWLVLLLVAALPWLPAAAAPAQAQSDERMLSYKIQPLDLLKVQIFQEPDLDREVRVSQDCAIVLPLIGRVDLKDRTVSEAQRLVTDLYNRDYLVNPQINITVTEYAPRSLNVLGAVNNPGAVTIPPEQTLTLLDAIARAGGFSRLANRSHVSLTHTLADGSTRKSIIDADQLVDGDAGRQWFVQNGDVIFVPERVL